MTAQSSELLTPSILKTVQAAQRRELAQPLLLFLAGHRPLAFVSGQLLTLCSPFGSILGWPTIHEWAELLSHADGPSILEEVLETQTHAVAQ